MLFPLSFKYFMIIMVACYRLRFVFYFSFIVVIADDVCNFLYHNIESGRKLYSVMNGEVRVELSA